MSATPNYTLSDLFAALGNPAQLTHQDVRCARIGLAAEFTYWRIRGRNHPRRSPGRRTCTQMALVARKNLRVVTAWLRVLDGFSPSDGRRCTFVFHAARSLATPDLPFAPQWAGSTYSTSNRSLQ